MTEEQAKQSKLAASTAILAAVTVATLSSGTSNSSSEGKRVFGSVAYERLLPKGDCHCVEKTSKKLQPLGDIVHVWVRDARSFRHGKDSTVYVQRDLQLGVYETLNNWPVLLMSCHLIQARTSPSAWPSPSLSASCGLVQKQFALLSPYKREVDGELQLCFDDYILDDDQPFSTYLPDGEASSSSNSKGATRRPSTWPKPFAGIVPLLLIKMTSLLP
ncbi:hypothetical protein BBJ28_00007271 [Nothophytophthora sp. Chile5]|nr:hypothetical protein BBJ28_00007271 [Nothophytophthora sp. Chile5]